MVLLSLSCSWALTDFHLLCLNFILGSTFSELSLVTWSILHNLSELNWILKVYVSVLFTYNSLIWYTTQCSQYCNINMKYVRFFLSRLAISEFKSINLIASGANMKVKSYHSYHLSWQLLTLTQLISDSNIKNSVIPKFSLFCLSVFRSVLKYMNEFSAYNSVHDEN